MKLQRDNIAKRNEYLNTSIMHKLELRRKKLEHRSMEKLNLRLKQPQSETCEKIAYHLNSHPEFNTYKKYQL